MIIGDSKAESREAPQPFPPRQHHLRPRWKSLLIYMLMVFSIFNLYNMASNYFHPKPALTTADGQATAAGFAQLQEVADLMDQIYTTLSKMQYIPPSSISRAPHNNPPINLTLLSDLELDPLVIELYKLLPYISGVENDAFIFDGTFADFRDDEVVEQSRDPFFSGWRDEEEGRKGWDGENGEYVRPWVTPLTMLGNHESVLVYDAREHRIWIIDQESWESTDPGLKDVESGESKSNNPNSFEHIPSRPAPDVLTDILKRYIDLEEIPSLTEWVDNQHLKSLYLKNGWPNNFNSRQFSISLIRSIALEKAKYASEEPLRAVEKYAGTEHRQGWIAFNNGRVGDAVRLEQNAKTDEERYDARFQLLQAYVRRERISQDFEAAKNEAERLCLDNVCIKPGEEVLWEFRELEEELENERDGVELDRRWLESGELDEKETVEYQRHLEKHEPKLLLVEEAFKQCNKEVERLCAERDCKPLPRPDEKERALKTVEHDRSAITASQEYLERLQEFEAKIPAGVVEAKTKTEQEIWLIKGILASHAQKLQQTEEWLAAQDNPLQL